MEDAIGHLMPADADQIDVVRSRPLVLEPLTVMSLARPEAHRSRILMVKVAACNNHEGFRNKWLSALRANGLVGQASFVAEDPSFLLTWV